MTSSMIAPNVPAPCAGVPEISMPLDIYERPAQPGALVVQATGMSHPVTLSILTR